MAHFDFDTVAQSSDQTAEQALVVAVVQKDMTIAEYVVANCKGETLNDRLKIILSADGTDAPVKGEKDGKPTYYSISHYTDGKTKEGKAYYEWLALPAEERKTATDTFFFVQTAHVFKAYCNENFEFNKATKKFRFKKNGEPVRKVRKSGDGNGSGSDKSKTRKVEDIEKSFFKRFDAVRGTVSQETLAEIRTVLLAIQSDITIDAKLPEVLKG